MPNLASENNEQIKQIEMMMTSLNSLLSRNNKAQNTIEKLSSSMLDSRSSEIRGKKDNEAKNTILAIPRN